MKEVFEGIRTLLAVRRYLERRGDCSLIHVPGPTTRESRDELPEQELDHRLRVQ